MENIHQIENDERSPLLDTNIDSSNSHRSKSVIESIFDPSRNFFRYFCLIFISLLTFGLEFCYVMPGALEDHFESDLKITTGTFTMFNSYYSMANVIFCFFGGFLIDNLLGVRLGAVIFSSFVTIGQILFGYGAYCNRIWLMNVGRFIFGYYALKYISQPSLIRTNQIVKNRTFEHVLHGK
jgi:hypothetical protein